jgi:hypothetical protein
MNAQGNVNRIGFELPTGYEIRDHIMWSKSWLIDGFVSVSGTDDLIGITTHGYEISGRKDGRVNLRITVRGQITEPRKVFENADAAKYYAAWHSESIIFASLDEYERRGDKIQYNFGWNLDPANF